MTHNFSLNVDDALKHFSDLLSQSRETKDHAESVIADFSDRAFGEVHQERTRRIREAMLKIQLRNRALANGLVEISEKGIAQVNTFAETDSGNATTITTIGDSMKGAN